ncbi:MAG: AraC family transcriptional regulator [Clostridiales bacterium]|nr:MAG: AraC family transcriptional regulator [Clostridiales bacterium]
MTISLEDMKNYLRVDFDDDDELIVHLISSAEKICMDILRTSRISKLYRYSNGKTAVMYAAAYLYEHREKAEHDELILTIRALLSADRKDDF